MSIIRKDDLKVINKMIELTEKKVERYADLLLKEEGSSPVEATLNSLVAVGQKLTGLYYDLIEASDAINEKDYNYIVNEIKREEANFVTLQGVYSKLVGGSSSDKNTKHRNL